MLTQADYVLIDVQNNEIMAREKISSSKCVRRNAEAQMVEEIFLQWQPCDSLFLSEHNKLLYKSAYHPDSHGVRDIFLYQQT